MQILLQKIKNFIASMHLQMYKILDSVAYFLFGGFFLYTRDCDFPLICLIVFLDFLKNSEPISILQPKIS